MKFGKIHDQQKLNQMSWQLPSADTVSQKFLASLPKSSGMKLSVGAPAWNHKQWVGKVYPDKTPASQFLYFYSRYFNTIELNTTHYRIPMPEQALKWCAQVPNTFLFCPKVFQGISHEKNGLLNADLLLAWYQFLESLQNYCGPCFLQLPPSFDYGCKAILFKFLQNWPSQFKLALEFRHPSWFENTNKSIIPALTQYLQTRGVGLVITDVAGRQDVLHNSISADFVIVRFVGNELHPSDFERATLWDQRLAQWKQQGLKHAVFLVHEPDDVLVPEITEHLLQLPFFKDHYQKIATDINTAPLVTDDQNLDFFSSIEDKSKL